MDLDFITVQDLTTSKDEKDERGDPWPARNVTLCIDPDKDTVHLLGVLPHNIKLGIDQPNALMLCELLTKKFPLSDDGWLDKILKEAADRGYGLTYTKNNGRDDALDIPVFLRKQAD